MVFKAALAVATAVFAAQHATALPAQGGKLIVGGELAKEGDVPFIVYISVGGSPWCGGSLVNARTVVTAAHCAQERASYYQIRAGSLSSTSGGKVSNISSISVHPSYNASSADSDIAIFKLSTPIRESSTIQYAKLPKRGSDPVAKSIATTAGWGDLEDGGMSTTQLHKVSVPVVDRAVCKKAYQDRPNPLPVTKNMFCAGLEEGGKDSCQGDSGGPIIDASTGILTGVVSWGDGCAQPNSYGVYVRLGNFVDFVKKNM